MKTIGIIGGMSWESSLEYYRILNREASRRLGGLHSADLLLRSLDFQDMATAMEADDWDRVRDRLVSEAQSLEQAGAKVLLVATNTMHRFANEVQEAVLIPLVHIADGVGAEAVRLGLKRLGLLGTKPTMELDFMKGRLAEQFGLDILVPEESGREYVHKAIFAELCKGLLLDPTRERFAAITRDLAAQGAQGVILGCTEIPLLLKPEDSPVPLLDTTRLHALAALEAALGWGRYKVC